ncbi:xylulokinase [Spirochaeta cellobiosiphila]|uniref:xylulokinase n=1 Tax=Spirochaeta cellobiosiphila TaxID=504483 RepID=UPI000411625F|nr:FGGY-family carbohydrate kinase [Spirochaeta cellobiosiphila]
MNKHVLTFDVGTTGLKTCIYTYRKGLTLSASTSKTYPLTILEGGKVEQNPDMWWQAIKDTIPIVLKKANVPKTDIGAIAFCSQMQGLVLCDDKGQALRPAMSYLDTRAEEQKKRFMTAGPQVADIRVDVLRGLWVNGAVPASVKDPIWKYLWVKENEPDLFSKVKYWLDVKEYLIFRLTGKAIMTTDTAFTTFLYDTRPGRYQWDNTLIRKYKINKEHLPPVVETSACVGQVKTDILNELDLSGEIQVFGSGGDACLIGLGAGSVDPGDTHVYTGTSGWVSTYSDSRKLDINAMIASVPASKLGYFNFFAEQETAGKCLEWVRDHLALDEIDLYLDTKTVVDDPETIYDNLFDFLVEEISKVPPGSHGVIFTPWLHGNRSPVEDPNSRGIFFNLSLDTGKRAMIRAVVEGIIFNERWLLESIEKTTKTNKVIRYVGGGAQNAYIGQMMADILQRPIEIPEHPQYAGTTGAAIVAAVGLGLITDIDKAARALKVSNRFEPDPQLAKAYDKNYEVFKKLYVANKKFFKILNHKT